MGKPIGPREQAMRESRKLTVLQGGAEPTEVHALPTLLTLAAQINAEHAAIGDALSTMLPRARKAGVLLLEAKAQVAHGEWGEWLATHFTGSERTARAYMQVARGWGEIDLKTAGSAVLSLEGALKLLASPKEESAEEEAFKPGAEPPPARSAPPDEPPKKERPAAKQRATQDPDPTPKAEAAEDQGEQEYDLADELARADAEIRRLGELVASLESGDLAAQVIKWSGKCAALEGRLQQEIRTKNEAIKDATYARGKLGEIRKLIGVESDREIVPKLKGVQW
jgi:hypothetical protein